MAGGLRPQAYVHNPMEWVDPLGLTPSGDLDKALGGQVGDKLSAHHVIPVDVWQNNQVFLNEIGMGGMRDTVGNGIHIPGGKSAYDNGLGKGIGVYHSSKHDNYSTDVDTRLKAIQFGYDNGNLTEKEARLAVKKEQIMLKNEIWSGDVSKCPKGRMN